MKLAALVGDGHSNVATCRDPVIKFHEVPISLYLFSDGLYVRATTTSQAKLLGAKVTKSGGVPVDDALRRVDPLIGRDNAMGPKVWAPVLLVMPEVLHAVGLSAS